MRDLGPRLREADPLRAEPALPEADVRIVGQRVIAAAGTSSIRAAGWQTAAIATAVVVTLAATVMLERRHTSTRAEIDSGAAGSAASRARRQLHFSTPGGRRVIWVFDSRFEP